MGTRNCLTHCPYTCTLKRVLKPCKRVLKRVVFVIVWRSVRVSDCFRVCAALFVYVCLCTRLFTCVCVHDCLRVFVYLIVYECLCRLFTCVCVSDCLRAVVYLIVYVCLCT